MENTTEAESLVVSTLLKIRSDPARIGSAPKISTTASPPTRSVENRVEKSAKSISVPQDKVAISTPPSLPPVAASTLSPSLATRHALPSNCSGISTLPANNRSNPSFILPSFDYRNINAATFQQFIQANIFAGGGGASLSPQLATSKASIGILPATSAALPTTYNPTPILPATARPIALSTAPLLVQDNVQCPTNDASHCNVRKEKVEAALHSKPQRGRKRDNLSEMERLELTRTRNREHAKSTRIRKKARYQELLDTEERLESVNKSMKCEQARRRAVVDFMNIRGAMLRTASLNEDEWKDQWSELTSSKFNFIISDTDVDGFSDEDADKSSKNSLIRCKKFDQTLMRKVANRFGETASCLLYYKIDEQSVALTSTDSAMAQVEVMLASSHGPIQVLSGFVSVKFVPNDSKLKEMKWNMVKCYLSDSVIHCLGRQTSHPSVVSLDPFTVEDNKSCGGIEESDNSEPGMDI